MISNAAYLLLLAVVFAGSVIAGVLALSLIGRVVRWRRRRASRER